MSDANRVALRYARETSYNVSLPALPAQDVTGTSTLQNLRFTKDSLDAGKEVIASEEIRADRLVSALVEVGVKPTGGFDTEVVQQEYDGFLDAALMANSLSSYAGTLTIAHSANTIAGTLTNLALFTMPPKYILVSGASNAANNGWKMVTGITAPAGVTTIAVAPGQFTADETSSITISVMGAVELNTGASTVVTQVGANTVYTMTAAVNTNIQGARYVKISGCANANNNGIRKVVSCTSNVLTVVTSPAGFTSETATITVLANYIRTGTTYVTHIIEKYFQDIPHFMVFTGLGVDTFDLKLEAKKIGTFGFAFMGYQGKESANTVSNLVQNSTTWTPSNSASNIGSVTKDGSAMLNPIKSIALKLNNNLRERPIISDLGSAAHGQGRSELTGQMEVYFANKELLREFLNHVSMAVEFPVIDLVGNVMNFYMPAVQSTKGTPIATGINTDVMQQLAFQAFMDPTKQYQFQIDRLLA